jgi:hypothetical protein
MTDSLWQSLVVGVALAAAVIYLIRITVKKRRSGGGCANCAAAKSHGVRRH